MNTLSFSAPLWAALLLLAAPLSAQTYIGNYFSPAGSATLALSYTYKSYDQFWMGQNIADAPNDGLNQNIVSLYGKYAITDYLEAVVNVPYISNTSRDGDVSFDGIQDLSLFLHGKVFEQDGFVGALCVGTNIATGYENEALYAIGNGATSFDGLLSLTYFSAANLSLNVQAGYSLRTTDTPNAFLFLSRLAYAHPVFYLDATFGLQRSADAIDIGGEGFMPPGDFPFTRVNYSQLTFSGYVPIGPVFGLSAYYGFALDGRNIGDYQFVGGGLVVNL